MKLLSGVTGLGLLVLTACSGPSAPKNQPTENLAVRRPEPAPLKPAPATSLPQQINDPWFLQDLSILFPIPTALPDLTALKMNSEGVRGKLLPDFAAQSLPLLETSLNQTTQAGQLQVVGMRIDSGEIHLVWQVFQNLTVERQTKISALDTAVHTFYQVDDLPGFTAELRSLAKLSRTEVMPGQALGVHPTLSAQGWNRPYGRALKSLILKWCGEKSLFKITFAASPQLARWFFGGSLIQAGQLLALEIPRINTTGTQLFVNSSSSINFLAGIMSPAAPSGQDEFNRLLADSSLSAVKEPQALKASHLTAVRLENPRLGNPQTLDCASCHMAQMVHDWTEDQQPLLTDEQNGQFVSAQYNLKRMSADKINTENVRAFGFFLSNPSISQRAINDTAFTAELMNQK